MADEHKGEFALLGSAPNVDGESNNPATLLQSFPPELLCHIFADVVTQKNALTREEFSRSADYSWIPRIIHVCTYWRAVALSTPHLWNNIDIFPSERSKAILEFMASHSKDCHLQIQTSSPPYPNNRSPDVVPFLLELAPFPWLSWIQPYIYRIRYLTINALVEMQYEGLDGDLLARTSWPALEAFWIHPDLRMNYSSRFKTLTSSVILGAPKLELLHALVDLDLPRSTILSIAQLHRLRRLCLLSKIPTLEDFSRTLSALPNLVELHISLRNNAAVGFRSNASIALPHLRRLTIEEGELTPILALLPVLQVSRPIEVLKLTTIIDNTAQLLSIVSFIKELLPASEPPMDDTAAPIHFSQVVWDTMSLWPGGGYCSFSMLHYSQSLSIDLTFRVARAAEPSAVDFLRVLPSGISARMEVTDMRNYGTYEELREWWSSLLTTYCSERLEFKLKSQFTTPLAPFVAAFSTPSAVAGPHGQLSFPCPALETLCFESCEFEEESFKDLLVGLQGRMRAGFGLKEVRFEGCNQLHEAILKEMMVFVEVEAYLCRFVSLDVNEE